MRHRRSAVLLVLLLVAAAGVAWYRLRGGEAGERAAAPRAADAAVAATGAPTRDEAFAPSPTRAAPRTAGPHEPLPPLDAPLDGFAEALAARADAGDSAAACRLGLELMRCQGLEAREGKTVVDDWQHSALVFERAAATRDSRFDWAGQAEHLQALVDHFRPIADACERVAPALHARGAGWLRSAALSGEPEALLMEASGAGRYSQGTRGSAGWLRSPEFDRWRREAPVLLQRALAAGRPEAVLLYADGSAGGEGALQGLLPDDAQQAATWRALAERLFGNDADRLLQSLVPLPGHVDSAAAEQQAAEWHARYFDGARFSESDLFTRSLVSDSPVAPTRAVGSGCGDPPDEARP